MKIKIQQWKLPVAFFICILIFCVPTVKVKINYLVHVVHGKIITDLLKPTFSLHYVMAIEFILSKRAFTNFQSFFLLKNKSWKTIVWIRNTNMDKIYTFIADGNKIKKEWQKKLKKNCVYSNNNSRVVWVSVVCFFFQPYAGHGTFVLLTKIIIGVYKFNWFFEYSSINTERIEVGNVMTSNLSFTIFCSNCQFTDADANTGWKRRENKRCQKMRNYGRVE